MGLFSSREKGIRYGAIIDVGSASVMSAIVRSDIHSSHPEIIWSKRDYVALKGMTSVEQSAKNVMTSLVNAVLALGNEGIKKLLSTDPAGSIGHLQVSVSAPWSYTITKSVNFTDDTPFEITKELVADLTHTAREKTMEELNENELVEELGLEVITRTTTDLIVNGYRSEEPFGEEATTLSLAHVSAVAQRTIIETVADVQHKILLKAESERYSFMLIFYCVLRELYPSSTEFCLIDITYEATEIGIVRDGVLRYTTHTPFGSYSIARELAAILDIPKEQAFSMMKAHNDEFIQNVPKTKLDQVTRLLTNYEAKITELFQQTGDTLSIPKTIFLHGGLYLEEFFKNHISNAALVATKGNHMVHQVTGEMLTKNYEPEVKRQFLAEVPDTSLLVSAQFFHKQHHCQDFEQL